MKICEGRQEVPDMYYASVAFGKVYRLLHSPDLYMKTSYGPIRLVDGEAQIHGGHLLVTPVQGAFVVDYDEC